jgi:hypothetical protein
MFRPFTPQSGTLYYINTLPFCYYCPALAIFIIFYNFKGKVICVIYSIVAYRPVAKRWLCKQRPFLGNDLVNTFPLLGRFLIKQQLDYNNENWVFLRGPCRDVIIKAWSLWRESSSREAVKRTSARETEESPLFEAIVRKRLVKTQQARKGLAFPVVICELWRLAIALYLLVVPSRVYKWSINPFTNLNLVYSHTYYTWEY